jgi:hypothetical protein
MKNSLGKSNDKKHPTETPEWTEEEIKIAELAEKLRDEGKL